MADGKRVTELLLKRYSKPETALNSATPLELLIATILSAQCTDKRVNEVTKGLFKKYQSVEDYADADINRLREEIRSTGFFNNKSKSIIGCCKRILDEYNGKVPSAMNELITLPGVGRKTANVVLAGAFGKQAIAVDTHVLRVSNRIGLANSKKPDEVEQQLMDKAPNDKWSSFDLALILHGRETCKARRPICNECMLYDECEWPDKLPRTEKE